jgi:hypothetical protein
MPSRARSRRSVARGRRSSAVMRLSGSNGARAAARRRRGSRVEECICDASSALQQEGRERCSRNKRAAKITCAIAWATGRCCTAEARADLQRRAADRTAALGRSRRETPLTGGSASLRSEIHAIRIDALFVGRHWRTALWVKNQYKKCVLARGAGVERPRIAQDVFAERGRSRPAGVPPRSFGGWGRGRRAWGRLVVAIIVTAIVVWRAVLRGRA